jgi:hypothetical protein
VLQSLKEGFHTITGILLMGPFEIAITGVKKLTRSTFPLFDQEFIDKGFEKKGWVLPHISSHKPGGNGLLTLVSYVAVESWIFFLDCPQVEGLFLNESHQDAVKKFYGLRHRAPVEIIGQHF